MEISVNESATEMVLNSDGKNSKSFVELLVNFH